MDAITDGAIAQPDQHVGLLAAVADNDGGTISAGAIEEITPLRFLRHGEPASRLSRVDFGHATQVIGGHDLNRIDLLHVGRAQPWFKPAGPVMRIPPPRIDELARRRERERAAPAFAIETTRTMDGQSARAKEPLLVLTTPLAISGGAVWPSKCGDRKAATHNYPRRMSPMPGLMRARAANS